ncbi:MAG: NAD-dependent epimerase/dehydratase family protein [Oligoflexia bacterium]|nr:NAD-dependent epimerase/dehydratase family protein [Oligoflexia bacterium]
MFPLPLDSENISTDVAFKQKQTIFSTKKSVTEVQKFYNTIFLSDKWSLETQRESTVSYIYKYRKEKKEISITIQGTGEETRAFCYVENGVQAIVLVGEKGTNGNIYHLGEMLEITICKLVELMAKILGLKISIIPGVAPTGATPRRCPDTSKIEKLGYQPTVLLEQGLALTLEWYLRELQDNKNK